MKSFIINSIMFLILINPLPLQNHQTITPQRSLINMEGSNTLIYFQLETSPFFKSGDEGDLLDFCIRSNPQYSYNDPIEVFPKAFHEGAGYRWWNLPDSVIISNYVTLPDYRKHGDTTLTNIEQTNMVMDTSRNDIAKPEIEKVLIGSMHNSQLTLFIQDSLIRKAISDMVSEPLTIAKMLIQRDFDETLFFYIEGKLGKNPVVLRIKLFQENETELFITKDSFLEYCLSKRKCKSPAFADLFGCKCLNGSSKSVDYHRIEGLNLQNLSGE